MLISVVMYEWLVRLATNEEDKINKEQEGRRPKRRLIFSFLCTHFMLVCPLCFWVDCASEQLNGLR